MNRNINTGTKTQHTMERHYTGLQTSTENNTFDDAFQFLFAKYGLEHWDAHGRLMQKPHEGCIEHFKGPSHTPPTVVLLCSCCCKIGQTLWPYCVNFGNQSAIILVEFMACKNSYAVVGRLY